MKRNLREIVRNLDQNKVLFELNRRSVQVAIENLEINRYKLEEPVGPNANGAGLGSTTAQNLTDAIRTLNNSQDSFLSSWVRVEVLRRSIDFDMGTMQMDPTTGWKIRAQLMNRLGCEPPA